MGSVWSSSSIIKLWPNSTFVCIRWSEGRVERKKKYSLKQDLSSEENDSAILFLGLLDQLGIGWCIWKKCSNHSRGHFGFYRIELKYFGFCISRETTLGLVFRIIHEWFEYLFKYFSWNLFSLQMLNEPIFCSLRWRKTKLVIMNHLEKVLGYFILL